MITGENIKIQSRFAIKKLVDMQMEMKEAMESLFYERIFPLMNRGRSCGVTR